MPRNKTEKWLLGEPNSILNTVFENLLLSGNDEGLMEVLPLRGPRKLPCKESVLKLYFSLRSQDRFSRRSDVPDIVAKLIKQYWLMAKIPTVDDRTIRSRIVGLVKEYDDLVKKKTRNSKAAVEHRETFRLNLPKIFELASPSAENEMKQERLLGNKSKQEDLLFLEDQRGPRLAHIGGRDSVYDKAVKDKLEGKTKSTSVNK